MKAIFLSAGTGTRLMPLTKNTPKPLLEIGEGLTIIESQLNSILESESITECVFVIGYRAEQIEAKLNTYKNIPIRFIYNPFYNTSNNLISLWVALSEMTEDFIIINGDNLFNHKLLQNLVNLDKEQSMAMIIHRKTEEYDEDDMKIISKGDRILQVSKEINKDQANGESIGISRFCNQGREILKNTLEKFIRFEKSKDMFYLKLFQDIMDQGFNFNYIECGVDDWREIDFHPDLKFIQSAALGKDLMKVVNSDNPMLNFKKIKTF